MTTSAPRALQVGVLLAVLLTGLLSAWFVSGWHDVRMRQQELEQEPLIAARQRAGALARELHTELEDLFAREARRPYFHYQNLMHDPRASPGINVSPSPLASGSTDKLVLGYFQVDATGRTTTPTINDAVPELSEPERLADHRAFRDRVTREFAPLLTQTRRSTPPNVARVSRPRTSQPTQLPTQQVQMARDVYRQNTNPNAVYSQSQLPREQSQRSRLETVTPSEPVTITISALEWRTLPFAGVPTIVGIREVQTPDGMLAQGFVVDRGALALWLGSKLGDLIGDLAPEDARGAAVAPGWSLTVSPGPVALAKASDEAAAVARSFVIRFVGIGSASVLAGALVVVFVRRAETLARERSQFAAAAAHELRTPLAGLQLYGDMLADGLGDPAKARDYARRMSDDAARLGRVVSNMLGFSELERGSLMVDAREDELTSALCELADRAQPALTRAGATLEVAIASDLRARFERDALARIVGNLLDNAEKHARFATDRTIRMAAINSGDVVEVSVEDRGPGVSDKTTLFRPFSRGAGGTDRPAGLGLGLALSQSLAHAMGGDLTYRPREGGGAVFLLRLSRV